MSFHFHMNIKDIKNSIILLLLYILICFMCFYLHCSKAMLPVPATLSQVPITGTTHKPTFGPYMTAEA